MMKIDLLGRNNFVESQIAHDLVPIEIWRDPDDAYKTNNSQTPISFLLVFVKP